VNQKDWAGAKTGFLTGDKSKDARNVAILLDTIAAVGSNPNLDALLPSIIDKAIAITNAERGLLLLKDPGSGELQIRVARDKMGNRLPANPRYSQSILDLRLVSVMCAPLTTADETLGVLYVDSRASTKGFTKGDLELFTTLGSQCGQAIKNAELVQAYLDQQRLKQELHVAKDIQQGMLPRKIIERPRIEIAGFSRPCDETGGDYFDYINMRDRHMGVVIGDVSGHGIGAALFMTTARALLRAFTYKVNNPAEVLGEVNRFLERDMPTGSFMTLFFAEIDTRTGALRYASAGHNPCFIFRKRTASFEDLEKTGPGLGIIEGIDYAIGETTPLAPGDILLLYTDGIPEAMSPDKELFGEERMKHLLAGLQERSPSEIVSQLVRAVTEFTQREEFEDDLTLVVVKGT